MEKKVKTAVNVLALAIALVLLDVILELGFSEGFYSLIGLVEIVVTGYLLFIVHKKD